LAIVLRKSKRWEKKS